MCEQVSDINVSVKMGDITPDDLITQTLHYLITSVFGNTVVVISFFMEISNIELVAIGLAVDDMMVAFFFTVAVDAGLNGRRRFGDYFSPL